MFSMSNSRVENDEGCYQALKIFTVFGGPWRRGLVRRIVNQSLHARPGEVLLVRESWTDRHMQGKKVFSSVMVGGLVCTPC